MTTTSDRNRTLPVGKMGLLSLQSICLAVRQVTSGDSSAQHNDKYCLGGLDWLGSHDALLSFDSCSVWRQRALCRHPNAVDIRQLLKLGCAAGFPGCIVGLINCMHWEWKNCPSGWQGMFQGKSGIPTVVLETLHQIIIVDYCTSISVRLQGH